MLSRVTEIRRVIMVRINPGDDILLGLRQAVKEHAIRNAAILTGIRLGPAFALSRRDEQ